MANDAQMVFDGTATTVLVGTATITNGTFSDDGTNSTETEFDNTAAGDRWPMAIATLLLPDAFASAPDDGSTIDLFLSRVDVGASTDDEVKPDTTSQNSGTYVGSFRISGDNIDQPKEIVISLLGVKKCFFGIQNNTGVTMSFSTGFTLKIEGFTTTPSA